MLLNKQLLVLNAITWTVYGSIEHLSHVIYGENHWFGSLLGAVFGYILTLFLAGLHKWLSRRFVNSTKVCGVILATFLCAVLWHNITRVAHHRNSIYELLNGEGAVFFSGASYSVLLFCAWFGLYFGISIYVQKLRQQKAVLKFQTLAKEAQLQSLRYQLNPHFLFNVLNSIDVAVLENDNTGAHNMIQKLSRLLRVTLESSADRKVTVEQELSILEDLITIEQQRYAHEIDYIKAINEDCNFYLLPSLILQPLIENALKFTWHAKQKRQITLRISKTDTHLNICVSNPDNYGAEVTVGTRSGLKNVQQRLQIMYENDASLSVYQKTGFFIVKLVLPLEKGE